MFDPVVVIMVLGVPVFLAAGVVFAVKRAADRKVAWDYVARELGLERSSRGWLREEALGGVVEGLAVQVTLSARNKEETTRLQVGAPDSALQPVAFHPRAPHLLGRLREGQSARTGDAIFDETIFVCGDPMAAQALLGADARAQTLSLVTTYGAVLAEGTLVVELPSKKLSGAAVAAALWQMLSAARALIAARERSADPPRALAHHALHDPVAEVRGRAFEALARQFGESPWTREVADAMPPFSAPDREFLRLCCCSDAVARAGLDEMARTNLPLALRGGALRVLVERFGYGESRACLLEALGAPSVVDRVAAVELIAAAGDLEQVPRLAALMLREDDTGAVAYAQALGVLGDARAEADLLQLLRREVDVVQCAAAVALGRVGTVHAIEPLLPFTEGMLRSGPVKEASREAVRAIQSRLGPVEAGRLSLAEDTTGRVSIAAEPDKSPR